MSLAAQALKPRYLRSGQSRLRATQDSARQIWVACQPSEVMRTAISPNRLRLHCGLHVYTNARDRSEHGIGWSTREVLVTLWSAERRDDWPRSIKVSRLELRRQRSPCGLFSESHIFEAAMKGDIRWVGASRGSPLCGARAGSMATLTSKYYAMSGCHKYSWSWPERVASPPRRRSPSRPVAAT